MMNHLKTSKIINKVILRPCSRRYRELCNKKNLKKVKNNIDKHQNIRMQQSNTKYHKIKCVNKIRGVVQFKRTPHKLF